MTVSTRLCGAIAVLATTTFLAHEAAAQSPAPWPANDWRFGATLYIYGPQIDSNFTLPKRSGEGTVSVNTSDYFNISGAFMGAFEATNGRWGVFTDYLYVDVSGSKSGTRNFSIGQVDLPASVTGDVNVGVKGSAWSILGEYRLQSTRESTADLLFGARLLDVKPRASFRLNGELGTIPPASREGSFEVNESNWDAIIGVKGRIAFGPNREWFVPYYVDVGTGDSDLTWQAIAGLGYSFRWGDLIAGWRYLDYNFKSSAKIDNMNLSGPIIGAALRW